MKPARALAVIAAVAVAGVVPVAASCIPQSKGDATEVGKNVVADPKPPAFPETGQVPADLLEKGLFYDFTTAPVDLNLWVPPADQATCAAKKIVADLGPRLSELGYLPGKSGAGLNDIALTDGERTSVSSLFQSCVDMEQAVASIFMGDGNMTSAQALCMAKGLQSKGLTARFADAWAFGTGVDPLAGDVSFGTTLLAYTDVCLPGTAFTWFGYDLPGDKEVKGVEGGDPGKSGKDLPGSAGKVTTTTEGRPTGG